MPAQRQDAAALLAWLEASIAELRDRTVDVLKAASDAAGYVHRCRSWMHAHDTSCFTALPDVVHGLSYVRCLAEHHLADTLDVMVVDEAITVDGEAITVEGEPFTVGVTSLVWRYVRELPPWPGGQRPHGRDVAYQAALQHRPVVETLEEARQALADALGGD